MESTPFGHYQLQKLIGRGGMGEVYQAYDSDTDRIVALKVLPPHLAQDRAFQERFRQESHAAAGVNDPHVVPIHGYGEIDGRLYLDMRLIEGRNLGAMLANTAKPMEPALAVSIVEQAGMALDGAHRVGLVHRDVKPSNILITDNDFVYLIDFGLARCADDVGVTTAGSTVGTLATWPRSGSRAAKPIRARTSTRWRACCTNVSRVCGRIPGTASSSRSPGTWCLRRRGRPTRIRGWRPSTR
ncbi:serine/threonine protein kinase [Mycolicibacterium conceptionense]|uniref:non-specific serine/threonine protein kinase n=1 Tax=Mycolicibacterium conceptionense TaxID=451644 RepID=A0A0U1D4Y4_9MYCO|nr:serine/threonine protein kinase [Mycolicibacterium conceptionense]